MEFLKNLFTFAVLSLPFIGAYAMFSVGIVVIYRASRVLNLAHGAMAMVPAYIVFSLVTQQHLPMAIAIPIGMGAGAVVGLLVERIFVRGLRHLGTTAQTVGTVAVLSFLMALAAKIWGTNGQNAPSVFPKGSIKVGASALDYGAIGLFIVACVVAVLMLAVFKYTDVGLAMRGAAENRRATALMGIDPDRTTALAWAIGGALAGFGGILLAAITTLHPYRLPLQSLPAFVAALMGALESLPGALFGSAAVGLLLGIVPAFSNVPGVGEIASSTGSSQLVLTVAALAIMFTRGQRFTAAARDDRGFSGRVRVRRKRKVPAPLAFLGVVGLVAWIWLPGVQVSHLSNANNAVFYILVGVSLVVLTGWVGQISLGHAALVGVGAFTTGIIARDFGVNFPLNLPLAAGAGALVAAVLGAVALRVRGLYLAVATLIFSWMVDEFLFKQAWFVGSGGSSTITAPQFGVKNGFPYFNLASDKRAVYLLGIAILALAMLAAANLRSSKSGRAWFATRGSEMAAASLGINVMRYKVLAFSISGFLAGAAGNLFIVKEQSIRPEQFAFTVSLFFLSIAVVGGLNSLGGIAVTGVLFAGLDELFLRVKQLAGYLEIVPAVLLILALLAQAHSGVIAGFGQAMARVFRRGKAPVSHILSRTISKLAPVFKPIGTTVGRVLTVPRRLAAIPRRLVGGGRFALETAAAAFATADAPEPNGSRGRSTSTLIRGIEGRSDERIVLEGDNITVRFGGLVAVAEASVQIRRGEIVGLIGPNGAGKTTLFNALSGLNEPTTGAVRLFGNEVSKLPVHERAKMGLARTFQVIQLFGDLTVRENLLVATHVHNETGFLAHMLATDRAVRAERDAHRRVEQILELLELGDIADRPTAGLPFGILRLIEIGRAVVTEAPMVMLDEATSGLDNTETDRLVAFLRSLRDRLGISMLVIEHDVQMVTGISDYMYVLNQGRLIAEGTPVHVQRDPTVIAAYLGEPAAPVGASA